MLSLYNRILFSTFFNVHVCLICMKKNTDSLIHMHKNRIEWNENLNQVMIQIAIYKAMNEH